MPLPTLHTAANPVIEVDLNGLPIDSSSTTAGRSVVGNVASGTTDSGNPVKIGGLASNAAPAPVAAGQRANLWLGLNGQQVSMIADSAGNAVSTSGTITTDAVANAVTALFVASRGAVFNGTTWDRQRGDLTGTWSHAPANTVSTALSGTIASSGATATVAFVNTVRQEIINPSTSTLWASWSTPSVNGAGSFPIAPGGSFSTDRTSGTLTVLSTAATQPFTVNRYA